ncbi:UBX domain [Dillenia turbinata]|uniref:UBX domain n=1 Tax=Dillenia turbinata TaxID=194707 RepID=A0AAN8Z1W8_9MAGN
MLLMAEEVYDDTSEGRKVCTYYKVDSIPAVLVIDPITGQKMRSWFGMIHPDRLLEDLLPFMDGGPKDHHVTLSHKRPRESPRPLSCKTQDETNDEDVEVQKALAASLEELHDSREIHSKSDDVSNRDEEEEMATTKKLSYPSLPEEPKGDRSLLCRVGVRLPDGRRLQRNFFRNDPIQLLWSFCSSQLEGGDARAFRLTQAIPGASKVLDFDSKLTFEESGLANSMISVTWD